MGIAGAHHPEVGNRNLRQILGLARGVMEFPFSLQKLSIQYRPSVASGEAHWNYSSWAQQRLSDGLFRICWKQSELGSLPPKNSQCLGL